MPWCDGCDRFWTTEALHEEPVCPSCGGEVSTASTEEEKAPWHFKLLVAAVVVYLAWRAFQLVARIA
ncbi:MAG TPA: hypothetical protein VK975_03200 [Acidimicrobiales bacterium]|nr:hypothetical protein [Acidimicrobiales bacterium]